jgi:CubicO group peptidase (beta-lactamase class C family)
MSDPTRRAVLLGGLGCAVASTAAAQAGPATPSILRDGGFAEALAASERRDGVSLLVQQGGTILNEAYRSGIDPGRSWNIYSGTKGLTGLYAAKLVSDGLIDFDEPVAGVLPQWQNDPRKQVITTRQLLGMLSGIEGPSLIESDPPAVAIRRPCVADPGTRFIYGPAPIQCFAAFVAAKLAASGASHTDPQTDLCQRLLAPMGIVPDRWPRGRGGAPVLATNCHLTARQWARIGRFILDEGTVDGRPLCDPAALADVFRPQTEQNAYGMGWWHSVPDVPRGEPSFLVNTFNLAVIHNNFGRCIVAGGYRRQRLFLFPDHDLIIVRQSNNIRASAIREGFGLAPRPEPDDLDLLFPLLVPRHTAE